MSNYDDSNDVVLWDAHNIPREITRVAETLGLSAIATGGGCDYVCLPNNLNVILGGQEDFAPYSLSDPSIVLIYVDENWDMGVQLMFDSALLAMNFMSQLKNVIIIGFPEP